MYYDLLTRIKNAGRAEKETVLAPFSNMDLAVAKILVEAGFLKSADKRVIGRKNYVEVAIAYRDKKPVLTDFKLISKPSRHLYGGYRELAPVRQGYGISVLSTPKGVMTNRTARKEKVGGEYLFQIW